MPKCPECDRVFDISNKTDMDEWHHGHDCEAPESHRRKLNRYQWKDNPNYNPTKKSNDRAFRTGWSVVKQGLNPIQEAAEQAKQNPPDDPHAGLPEELRPDNPWNKAAIRRKEEADAYKVWNDSFKRRGA